jgi:hypothetical protein
MKRSQFLTLLPIVACPALFANGSALEYRSASAFAVDGIAGVIEVGATAALPNASSGEWLVLSLNPAPEASGEWVGSARWHVDQDNEAPDRYMAVHLDQVPSTPTGDGSSVYSNIVGIIPRSAMTELHVALMDSPEGTGVWRESPWFGEFIPVAEGSDSAFLFHKEHGWLALGRDLIEATSVYDFSMGWLQTRSDIYPFWHNLSVAGGQWQSYVLDSGSAGTNRQILSYTGSGWAQQP